MDLAKGNGVNQWLFQRLANISGIALGLCIISVSHDGISFQEVNILLSTLSIQVYLAVTAILLTLNSYLAGWQIVGDYARKFSLPGWLLNIVIAIVSIVYLAATLILVL